jgi:hypothetical protein
VHDGIPLSRNGIGAFLTLAAALAPAPVPTFSASADPAHFGDPNERICEDIVVTGRRIAKKRFCGTRAEWEEKRMQDRKLIEEIQRSPCQITRSGGNQNACVPL